MKGYIKDYRQELESDIWLMPPLYHRVWQWLKYNVNHEDKEIPMKDGSKFIVKKGQRLASVRNIAKGVAWYEGLKYKEPNPKTISTILKWLEKQQMITIDRGKGNRQYTLITLLNWEIYQSKDDEGNAKVTAEKQRVDINKNDKNDKEDIYTIFEHWKSQNIIQHKKMNQKMQSHINARLEDYSVDDLKKAIDNYKAVLMDDKYFWSHKWTLQDFMKPNNVVRFMDGSDPFTTYLKNKPRNVVSYQSKLQNNLNEIEKYKQKHGIGG